MELVDLAVFSFGCQSGLKTTHKVRGDPVIEGVCAFFGELIACSKEETRKEFEELSAYRLGVWCSNSPPTRELATLVS
jgi:hypothetical protein